MKFELGSNMRMYEETFPYRHEVSNKIGCGLKTNDVNNDTAAPAVIIILILKALPNNLVT